MQIEITGYNSKNSVTYYIIEVQIMNDNAQELYQKYIAERRYNDFV